MKSLSLVIKPFVLLPAVLLIMAHVALAQDVTFIVSNATTPAAADEYMLGILQNDRLFDVTLVDQGADAATTLAAAEASDITVVSESVGSGAVGTEIIDTTKPVIYYEPWVYDDLNWTDGTTANDFLETTDSGNAPGLETITILDPSHPLAGGLSGDVSVYINPADPLSGPAAGSIGYARFGPSFPLHANPKVVATIPGAPEAATIFVFEPGDLDRLGNEIPGLRIGIFPVGLTFEGLEFSADGLTLFNAALDYALGDNLVFPGDVNSDGVTNAVDYGIIRDHFHQSATERADGDLNRDGIVDFLDFRRWKNDPNRTSSVEGIGSVPEPSCAVFAVLAVLIGYAPSRRKFKGRIADASQL